LNGQGGVARAAGRKPGQRVQVSGWVRRRDKRSGSLFDAETVSKKLENALGLIRTTSVRPFA
jgi:hypothetical protein